MKTIVKNNLSDKYSKGTIIIHWLSFLLIIALIPTGIIMEDMEPGVVKINLLRLHALVGIIVFCFDINSCLVFLSPQKTFQIRNRKYNT